MDRLGDNDMGDFLVPPDSNEVVARLGEVAALRQITATLSSISRGMESLANEQRVTAAKLAEMHTDITVMKLQKEDIATLKTICADHEGRIKATELLHANEAGARKGLINVREWAPTTIALLGVAFALFKTGAIHL